MSTLTQRLSRLESRLCAASDEDDRAAEAMVRIERGRPVIDDYRWAFDLAEYRRYLLALTGLAAIRETLVQPDGDDVPDFQQLLRVIALPAGQTASRAGPGRMAVGRAVRHCTAATQDPGRPPDRLGRAAGRARP